MLSALYRDCAPHTYGTSVLPVLLCGRCCRRRHKGLCRRRASCRRRARSTTSRLRLPAGDAPRQGAAHKKSDRAGPVWRTGPPQTSVLIRYAALNFFYAGASVSGAIVLRSIMGPVMDVFGARKGMLRLMAVCTPGIIGMMFATNAAGEYACAHPGQ